MEQDKENTTKKTLQMHLNVTLYGPYLCKTNKEGSIGLNLKNQIADFLRLSQTTENENVYKKYRYRPPNMPIYRQIHINIMDPI